MAIIIIIIIITIIIFFVQGFTKDVFPGVYSGITRLKTFTRQQRAFRYYHCKNNEVFQ